MGKLDVDKNKGVDMDAEMKDIEKDIYETVLTDKKKRLADSIVEVDNEKDSTPFNQGYSRLMSDAAERDLVRHVKSKKKK